MTKKKYKKGGEVEKHYKIEFLDENDEIIDTERYGEEKPTQKDYEEIAEKLNSKSGILYSYDEDDEDDTFEEQEYFAKGGVITIGNSSHYTQEEENKKAFDLLNEKLISDKSNPLYNEFQEEKLYLDDTNGFVSIVGSVYDDYEPSDKKIKEFKEYLKGFLSMDSNIYIKDKIIDYNNYLKYESMDSYDEDDYDEYIEGEYDDYAKGGRTDEPYEGYEEDRKEMEEEMDMYIKENDFMSKGGVLDSDEKQEIDDLIDIDIHKYNEYDDLGVKPPSYDEYADSVIEFEITDKSKRDAVLEYIKSTLGKRDEYIKYWKEEDYAKGGKVKVQHYGNTLHDFDVKNKNEAEERINRLLNRYNKKRNTTSNYAIYYEDENGKITPWQKFARAKGGKMPTEASLFDKYNVGFDVVNIYFQLQNEYGNKVPEDLTTEQVYEMANEGYSFPQYSKKASAEALRIYKSENEFAKGGYIKVGRDRDKAHQLLRGGGYYGKYYEEVQDLVEPGDGKNTESGMFVFDNKSDASDALYEMKMEGINIVDTDVNDYAKGGDLDKEFKFDSNFIIYVPSTSDVSSQISKDELNSRVEEVKEFVSNHFGGYTETQADGGYKSDSGDVVEEDVVKVSVFAKEKDWENRENLIVAQVKEWANKWGQEAIGFEYEDANGKRKLYYIDREGKKGFGGFLFGTAVGGYAGYKYGLTKDKRDRADLFRTEQKYYGRAKSKYQDYQRKKRRGGPDIQDVDYQEFAKGGKLSEDEFRDGIGNTAFQLVEEGGGSAKLGEYVEEGIQNYVDKFYAKGGHSFYGDVIALKRSFGILKVQSPDLYQMLGNKFNIKKIEEILGNMVKFMDTPAVRHHEIEGFAKGGNLPVDAKVYSNDKGIYTVVDAGSVFEMTDDFKGKYIGELTDFPSDITHWGKMIDIKEMSKPMQRGISQLKKI